MFNIEAMSRHGVLEITHTPTSRSHIQTHTPTHTQKQTQTHTFWAHVAERRGRVSIPLTMKDYEWLE